MSFDDIEKLYPNTIINNVNEFIIPVARDVQILINIDGSNPIAWDNKGNNYKNILNQIIIDVDNDISVNSKNKLLLILQYFKDHLLGGTYGMEQCESKGDGTDVIYYDASKDNIWTKLKNKFNVDVNRKLHIYTFGTSFIFDNPKDCQKTYNAAILRGSHKKRSTQFKELVKMRGTDLQIQQEIRECPIFCDFIQDIVKDIESNNLHTIAITCRAGHHRSVACAEMLVHLYVNRKVNHLTIKN